MGSHDCLESPPERPMGIQGRPMPVVHVNEKIMADRIRELEAENKVLWDAIDALGVGKCKRCGKPSLNTVGLWRKEFPVCPFCDTEWGEVMKTHFDSFVDSLDSDAYHTAYENEFKKFFGIANNG